MDESKDRNLPDGGLPAACAAAVAGGDNKIFHNAVRELAIVSGEWADVFADCLFSLENIVKNPRKFIAEEDNIVEVERARRTTAKTVRHLASHTKYIANADGEEVRPKSVLTTEYVEDLAIYENRFVCTLVHRMISFAEARWREVDGRLNQSDYTNLVHASKFPCGKAEVCYEMKLSVKEPTHDRARAQELEDLAEKIGVVRKRLRILQSTGFIRALSKARAVRPPIMKTNLLTKQIDYKKCYQTWLYISSYDAVGFSAEVSEKNLPVSGDYCDELSRIAAESLESLFRNGSLRAAEYDAIAYSDPKKKNFRTVRKYSYIPDFRADEKAAGEEAVNEYYYLKMKEAFGEAARCKEGAASPRALSLAFARYFRCVSRVNDGMYRDLVRASLPEEPRGGAVKKAETELRRQELLVRRYGQIATLRKEELARTLRQIEAEEEKLGKAKKNLERIKIRERQRLEKQRIRQERAAAERERRRIEKLEKIDAAKAEAQRKAAEARERAARERRRRQAEKRAAAERARVLAERARAAEAAKKRAEEAKARAREEKRKAAEAAKKKAAEQRAKERAAAAKAAAAERKKTAEKKAREREAQKRAAAREKERAERRRRAERVRLQAAETKARERAKAASARRRAAAKQLPPAPRDGDVFEYRPHGAESEGVNVDERGEG